MGKVSVELLESCHVQMCMHTVHSIDIAADVLLAICLLCLLYCWSSLPCPALYSAKVMKTLLMVFLRMHT